MKPTKQTGPKGAPVSLTDNHLSNPKYNPANLLDALIQRNALKNDAALSRLLRMTPAVVSKVRHKHVEVTPAILVRMYDVSGIEINELRALMGLQAPVFH